MGERRYLKGTILNGLTESVISLIADKKVCRGVQNFPKDWVGWNNKLEDKEDIIVSKESRFIIFACFLLSLGIVGCATPPPTQVALDYKMVEKGAGCVDLSGHRICITPFEDARTNKLLYKKHLIMREGDDAGIWVANAIRMELEGCGAQVDTLEAGVRPSTGVLVSGRTNVLKATASGWQPGGLLGAATAGFYVQIDMNVELSQDGVPLLSKQYNIKKRKHSNPVGVWLLGASPSVDVPPAFQVGMRKLIRDEILPDMESALMGTGEAEK